MKRNYSDKSISGGEDKGGEPKALRCLRECVAPGYGFFKPGDKVTDPELVEYLKSNPNFEETKEVD